MYSELWVRFMMFMMLNIRVSLVVIRNSISLNCRLLSNCFKSSVYVIYMFFVVGDWFVCG